MLPSKQQVKSRSELITDSKTVPLTDPLINPQTDQQIVSQTVSRTVLISEKRYQSARGGDLLAIKDLQFDLPENRFTCIVGPSGCGKTTALRIILGLDTHYQGNIPDFSKNRTAAVFQEPRLLPWRTVRQNVQLCLQAAGLAETSNTAMGTVDLERLFSLTGLNKQLDFYPSELSLGLARRVALVRAFSIQPGLLVLDEPFVSLDEKTASRLRQLLLSIWQERPTTALMVTHNLTEAAELADQVYVFGDRPCKVIGRISIQKNQAERTATDINAAVTRLEEIQAKS